ncbi:MAG: dTDP-4-dehydrorhamnose reductase [Actinomycetota bacterium]
MRIVVAGAAGQLGMDVVPAARSAGHDVVALDRSALDLADPDAADVVLAELRPEVVVNCAAFTAVDACETEVETAHSVNEHGVRRLAEACGRNGARLVHVSTDYVFDGTLDRPYREDDEPNPASVYGRSKLAGEAAARDVLGDGVTIVRTSWVCGAHGANMVKTVLRLAADPDRPLAFVDDQRGCPTFTADLGPALVDLADSPLPGIVHLTNSGDVSWFEFVGEILSAAGRDPSRVSPISTADLDPPRPAPRPANSVLENVRWVADGRTPLRHHLDPLVELVAALGD